MKSEMKDTVEFVAVNMSAVGISLTNLDDGLRILILVATLTYSIQKINYYRKRK